jgi:Nuclease-related domain
MGDADETSGDLSSNRPGASARRKAQELKEGALLKTLLVRILKVHTEERAFRVGADGEVEVGRRLAKLGEPWRTVHAIPIGDADSDIDHVVIGPPGVFTLNTKHHPNGNVWVAERTFMVNGKKVPYLPKAVSEAKRASRLLTVAVGADIAVRPVIVVMGATSFKIKSEPVDVKVIGRRDVVRWLQAQPAVLATTDVEAIYSVARLASTWGRTKGN